MISRLALRLLAIALVGARVASASALPTVASLNLCADQLVLDLADPEQILSLSWLASDPEESLVAATAARYPSNFGSAEELITADPDVVVAGTYTAPATRAMLRRLGYTLVELAPAESVAAIAANVVKTAAALGQAARGQRIIAGMQEALARLERTRPRDEVAAIVLRPGRFTVGRDSLAHELLSRAGLRNAAASHGLDRWGSLSLESLLTIAPPLVILDEYRHTDASLANTALEHPALRDYLARVTVVRTTGSSWSCGLPASIDIIAGLQEAARNAFP
jgi:iron complex transport system substrate-binding protein